MSKTIEALKLAEVWIESLTGLHREVKQEQDDLLFVIREALTAIANQKPVAWKHESIDHKYKRFRKVPLYAEPVSEPIDAASIRTGVIAGVAFAVKALFDERGYDPTLEEELVTTIISVK